MVPVTLDGSEGDSAEQKFSKVRGFRLGCSVGDILTKCRRPIEYSFPCQLLKNCYEYVSRVDRPRGIYRTVTTVLVVVRSYTVCPCTQLISSRLRGQCCGDYTNLHS
jgi:hypothetical protein